MNVPQTLDAWNLEIIQKIVDHRIPELDFFDFKKQLPHAKDEDGKKRLRKEICAFANSSGGFLIFGVTDASELSIGMSFRNRIVGMEADEEFLSKFGIDTGIFSLTKSCKINHDLETIPSNQNTTRRAPHCRV